MTVGQLVHRILFRHYCNDSNIASLLLELSGSIIEYPRPQSCQIDYHVSTSFSIATISMVAHTFITGHSVVMTICVLRLAFPLLDITFMEQSCRISHGLSEHHLIERDRGEFCVQAFCIVLSRLEACWSSGFSITSRSQRAAVPRKEVLPQGIDDAIDTVFQQVIVMYQTRVLYDAFDWWASTYVRTFKTYYLDKILPQSLVLLATIPVFDRLVQ
ncbi:hypothetical protein Plhal304r1_c014g0053251 [Plasmopara halstedii]